MTTTSRHVRSVYRGRYAIGLVLIAISVIFLVGERVWVSERSAKWIETARIASDLKALSQRVTFLSSELVTEENEAVRDTLQRQFDTSLRTMQRRHADMIGSHTERATPTTTIAADLLHDAHQPLIGDIEHFLWLGGQLGAATDIDANDPRLYELIGLGTNTIMQAYDVIARITEHQGRREMSVWLAVEFLIGLTVLLVLLIVAILVFEPFGIRIQAEIERAEESETRARAEAERTGRASEAKSNFLRVFSHEIRTPLNAVIGIANLFENDLSDEEIKRHAREIRSAGDHMLALANDVLTLNEKDGLEPDHGDVPTDVAGVIRWAGGMVAAEAREKDLELSFDIDALPLTLSDPHRVRKVLVNLLTNAVKFTKTGSVAMTARLFRGDQKGAQAWIIVDVIDTGIGIPPSHWNSIFDQFEQAQMVGSRSVGGAGLGLAISQKLAGGLGGRLRLVTSDPAGSHFRFTLPFRPVAEEPVAGIAPVETSPDRDEKPTGGRVLVVDDIPVNRMILTSLVSAAGFEVVEAADGRTAVDLALADPHWACILMDIEMPVMDGITATKRLREARIASPIVAVTAHVLNDDVGNLLTQGFDEILTKPVDRHRILDVISARSLRDAA